MSARKGGGRWWQAAGRWTALLLTLLVSQEILARAIFPLPEAPGFRRLAYARGVAPPSHRPLPSLAHRTLWWWSAPDGASFKRRLNLYGFRGPTWHLAKGRRPRVAFIGDSFIEGLGAPDGATIPEAFALRVASHGPVEAMNVGAAGFGLEQYLPLIRDTVALFDPDEILLGIYMNDLYTAPDLAPLDAPPLQPGPSRFLVPRIPQVLEWRREGRRVPRRWHGSAGAEPEPLNVGPRLEASPELARAVDRWVDADLAADMRAGRLNPAVTNLLVRSERVLRQPADVEFLGGLVTFLRRREVVLRVVYIPSLNQVSDAYRAAQERMSAPIESSSLTGPEFQLHARQLGGACEALGVAFLDLTPVLHRREEAGDRLYWAYDGHMTPIGYGVVGAAIGDWWLAVRADEGRPG